MFPSFLFVCFVFVESLWAVRRGYCLAYLKGTRILGYIFFSCNLLSGDYILNLKCEPPYRTQILRENQKIRQFICCLNGGRFYKDTSETITSLALGRVGCFNKKIILHYKSIICATSVLQDKKMILQVEHNRC